MVSPPYHYFFLPLLWFVLSCASDNVLEERPFSHVFDFKQEIERLNVSEQKVSKTITQNDTSITALVTPDWSRELDMFAKADFNQYKYSKSFTITEVPGSDGLITYKYIPVSGEKTIIKEATYTFKNDACILVNITVLDSTVLYKNLRILSYEPNKGYSIHATQSTGEIFNTTFELDAKFTSANNSWRALLNIGGEVLPFLYSVKDEKEIEELVIYNGQEQIAVTEITQEGDSVIIQLPIFDSEIRVKYYKDSAMIGYYYDNSRNTNYNIPFYGACNIADRFEEKGAAQINISGSWKVTFSPEKENKWDAVGIFKQVNNKLSGTFLTETGDFRYLDGIVVDNKMSLSCFDGAHAFLFKAEQDTSGKLHGMFYSGSHWREAWVAERSTTFKLADPDSLTYLLNPKEKFTYAFPNLDSVTVSLADDKYQGKVVITQIMGSWCPNCMDETRELAKLHRKYENEGLEVIALAFERAPTFKKAAKNINRLKKEFNADYEFLIAGSSGKNEAGKSLPMLNEILSYPTTIITNRQGEVVKIHTGFFGPGTGIYYEHHMKETEELLVNLLSSNSAL